MPKKTRLYLIGILSLGYVYAYLLHSRCGNSEIDPFRSAVMIGVVKVVCQNVFRGIYDQSL